MIGQVSPCRKTPYFKDTRCFVRFSFFECECEPGIALDFKSDRLSYCYFLHSPSPWTMDSQILKYWQWNFKQTFVNQSKHSCNFLDKKF